MNTSDATREARKELWVAKPYGLAPSPARLNDDPGLASAWHHLVIAAEEHGQAEEGSIGWTFLLQAMERSPEPSIDNDVSDTADALRDRWGLPWPENPLVDLRAVGGLHESRFDLRTRWEWSARELFDLSYLTGAWYEAPRSAPRLLSLAAFELWTELSGGPPASRNDRLLWWGRVKGHAGACHATLDRYLEQEDVVVVDKIRPGFRPQDDGSLEIVPESAAHEGFAEAVIRANRVQDYYSESDRESGRRRRYAPTAQAREGLQQVFRRPRYTREEAPEVLSRPEEYFDTELFDLSEYSDRVLGLGEARYRANVVVRSAPQADPSTGEVEERIQKIILRLTDDARPDADPIEVDISDPGTRESLATKTEQALAEGHNHIRYEDRVIRVDPTLGSIFAELPDPGSPQRDITHLQGKILLIHENLENLAYGTTDDLPLPREDYQPPWPQLLDPQFPPRTHQRDGYRWLRWWDDEASSPIAGGLLADDMGLGKTYQLCSLIAARLAAGKLRPCLIVAPASLLENWAREIRRFLQHPSLRIANIRDDIPRGHEQACESIDINLTTYETLHRRDVALGKIPWSLVIADEATKVKNPTTRAAHALMAMRAGTRIALTGTPVETSLDELWSITDFIQPGHLGSLKDFRTSYNNPSVLQDPAARTAAREELRRRMQPIVVRRLKSDVAEDLPQKSVHTHRVPFSEFQDQLFRLVGSSGGPTLAVVQKKLKICSDPFSVAPQARRLFGDASDACPKLGATLELLEQVRQRGEKAIIFARWYSTQEFLAEEISKRFGARPEILNGTVPSGQRVRWVERFEASPGFGVLILGPRACGMGLNITGANHVIHYTREWNPAVESQATDRAYRIGQSRDVFVHVPVAVADDYETTDERLAELLSEREALMDDFMQPTAGLEVTARELEARGPAVRTHSDWDLSLVDPAKLAAAMKGCGRSEVRPAEESPEGAVALEFDGQTVLVVTDIDQYLASSRKESERPDAMLLLSEPSFLQRRRLD